MSYASESRQVLHQDDITNPNVQATSDVIKIMMPYRLFRLGYLVTTIISGAMTITVTRRVTVGSDTNEVTLETLTIPDTTAAGKVVYKNITPTDLEPGDEIEFACTQAGAKTGAGICFVEAIPRPEMPANLTDMVASA